MLVPTEALHWPLSSTLIPFLVNSLGKAAKNGPGVQTPETTMGDLDEARVSSSSLQSDPDQDTVLKCSFKE